MSQGVSVLLEDQCVKAYVRYLGALRVVESDYGLFDKLARPRDFEDFARVVYESVRVQERVLRKLQEGVSRKDLEVVFEPKGEDVSEIFRIGKDCIAKIMELAKDNPRLVGSVIASLAIAYDGIRESREKEEEGSKGRR